MTDLKMSWDAETATGDVVMQAGDLAMDGGLSTAVLISLFSDRRAEPDDRLPDAGGDRRGWWGDLGAARPAGRLGSRLWLLEREKRTPAVVARAREYAEEALAWLVADGVARRVEVATSVTPEGWLALQVIVIRPEGPDRQRFDFVWRTPA